MSPTQAQIDAALKAGYSMEQINKETAAPGTVKRSAIMTPATPTYAEQNIIAPNVTGIPINTQKTMPVGMTDAEVIAKGGRINNGVQEFPIGLNSKTPPATSWETIGKQKDPTQVSNYLNTQPGFKTTVNGNTVTGTKNGVQTTWVYDGANWVTKPTIATSDTPVIGTPPATTPTTTTTDFTTMTPEQLKSRYMEIGTKLPGEVTDEDRKFTRYLQTRMSLGETPDKIFGTSDSKSSGTTTYSPQLNRDSSMYQSSVKNADGTWTVTYKDGGTQVITENPTKTVFPEGTPEYFAQKQAEESEKRIADLTTQMTTEEERRKKETADLVAKYGENIATQFATQKADIEANGAKRMDTLNTGLSFSGFGRSTLALEKRDEIAKNIETTINQAKAKADLELMAYRMEREGADAEAISAMRTNIANVQTKIDDANYANQLEIIKLNQENATTGAEAMNNLLSTISDSEEIVSNADLEKSQMLGYFVNKDGSIMLDSQKRPIQFEGNPGSLDPSSIGAYADALSKGIIDEKGLDKLSPADKAAVLKHVSVQNGTYTPPVSVSEFIAKEEGFRDKAYWDVNGWAVGYGQHSINGKPVVEGQTITKQEADADLANRVANARFNKLITVPLSESQKAALYSLEHNVGGGVWTLPGIPAMIEAINQNDFNKAADLLLQSGVGRRNVVTKEELPGLIARRQREADLLRQSGGGQTGTKPGLSPDTQQYIKNGTELKFIPKEDRQRVLTEMQLYGQSTPRTQEIEYNLELVDEILNNENLDKIVGNIQGRLPGMVLGGDVQYLLNQFNQLKNLITLDARQKLKGSGAISDFESKLLASSSSALGRNLDETAVRKELQKIKDAFSGKYKYYTGDINQYIAEQNATTGQSGTVGGEATVTNTNLIDSLR